MKSLLPIIRKNMYKMVSVFDKPNRNPDVIILCYHSVSNDNWRFSVSLDALKKQINYLSKIRTPISLNDLIMYLDGKKEITSPSFIVTFDDGYKNIETTVEYFKKKNIKPTVFVLGNPENANRAELESDLSFLSIEEIKKLKDSGWTIGVHSLTHANFSTLTLDEMKNEIQESKILLEKKLGFELPYFAYPKGQYSKEIIRSVIDGGYKAALSMNDGFIVKKTDKYVIPRIGVDATHGIDEFKVLFSPSVIRLRGLLKQSFVANFFKS